MDLNLGPVNDPPNKERDVMRRRLAAQLLQGERMPDQISSPGAARGLALASALKSLAGAALTIQQDRQDAERSAKWGEMGKQFSSLLGGGGQVGHSYREAIRPEGQSREGGFEGNAPGETPAPAPRGEAAFSPEQASMPEPQQVGQSGALPRPAGAPTVRLPGGMKGGGYTQAIVDVENRNGPADARNPRSTAMGDGQFIDGTWLDVLKRNRPDLAGGKTDAQILALRADRGLSREMIDAYGRENAQALRAANLPVTPAGVALSHRFGSAGAASVLRAPAETPIADVVGPRVMAANPDLKGRTAGDVRSGFEAKFARTVLRWGEEAGADAARRGAVGVTYGRDGLEVVDPEQIGQTGHSERNAPGALPQGARRAAMLTQSGSAPSSPATDRGAAMAARLTPEGVSRLQQAALAAAQAGHPQAAAFLQLAGQQAAMLERQNAQDLAARDREEARRMRAEDRADTRSFQERQFADTADGRRQSRELAQQQFELQRQQFEQGRLPPGYRMGANGQAEAIPGLPASTGERAPEGYRWNADRTAMEPIPGGPAEAARRAEEGKRAEVDAGKQRTTENDLRGEYTKLTADFRTVQDAHTAIQAAARSQTGAGDMSMLYSFVKLLDPTSVVRESEFATAAASGSYGERIQGAAQRLMTGERMADSLRNSFLAEADNLLKARRQSYDQVTTAYRGLAERSGARPDQVLVPFAREGAPAAQTSAAQSPARPQVPAQPAQSAEVKARTAQALTQARSRLGPGATDAEVLAETQRLLYGR